MFFPIKKINNRIIFFTIISILSATVVAAAEYNSSAGTDGTFNVCDYGAEGDGIHLNTNAIQTAIDECAKKGGTVVIPAGRFLSGTLFMRSNVTLNIGQGAVLLGSTDIHDYPEKRPSLRSYTDNYVTQSLIYGEDLHNIAITGLGTIDGQGSAFKPPTEAREDRYKNRPYIIRFITCKNILVENIKLQNSAMWMQHYLACDHVTIRGITVYNHCNMNNDMIDIDGCHNVIISDCIGDSDDDALTLKSTSGRLCENVTITNCVISSHCNGIKCGTESSGGFKNISISNIVVRPSKDNDPIFGYRNGISGISLEIVDGGIMDGITISNIRIDGPRVPIFLRLGNRARIYKEGMEKPSTGLFRNVNISNIIASGADDIGCSITGLPGHLIRNVSLSNIRIDYKGGGSLEDASKIVAENDEEYPESTMFGKLPAYGFYIRHAGDISMNNIVLTFDKTEYRPALICDDVQGLDLLGFRAAGILDNESLIRLQNTQDVFIYGSRPLSYLRLFLSLRGENTKRIVLSGNDLNRVEKVFETINGADEKEVKYRK